MIIKKKGLTHLKTVAIILIRSGSEGLPDKNIRHFLGKPLCFWTIQQALDSNVFDEIWVSSDSKFYLSLCKTEFGSFCEYILRDKGYSLSTTTTFETLENMFSNVDEDFVFMNLQVTSPLRTSEQIKESLKLFKESRADHLVSFCKSYKSKSLFMSRNHLNFDYLDPSRHGGDYRRQNETNYIYPNGSIWVSTKLNYLKDKTFYSPNTYVYEMDKQFSFDIDDEFDFKLCELIMENLIEIDRRF